MAVFVKRSPDRRRRAGSRQRLDGKRRLVSSLSPPKEGLQLWYKGFAEPAMAAVRSLDRVDNARVSNDATQHSQAAASIVNPHHASNDSQSVRRSDLIFAYGSLINSASRTSTLKCDAKSQPWVAAAIVPEFGYERAWNFRSDTGFTALGLELRDGRKRTTSISSINGKSNSNNDGRFRSINGVIHTVGSSIEEFDKRERGYTRIQIPMDYIEIGNEFAETPLAIDILNGRATVWVYVPSAASLGKPNEDFPICQTYLDVVLEGCLEVGGEEMASDFVLSTQDWSMYFLNDTPTSRRPWMHRKQYEVVERILQLHSDTTLIQYRRHPEEFANEYLTSLRGIWGIPQRNPRFCGREAELSQIAEQLPEVNDNEGEHGTGISCLHIIGLGGVGKSQLVTEYAYRQYSLRYGLIIWLDAETPETISAGMRKLATDAGLAVDDKADEEIIDEVKGRLYRTRCNWLIIYDNVENPKVVEDHLPRGARLGNVLVTSRRIHEGWEGNCITLNCFRPEEAYAFLLKVAGTSSGIDRPSPSGDQKSRSTSRVGSPIRRGGSVTYGTTVGAELAERLGHLPLALAVAASYMQRYDLECEEYLSRLQSTTKLVGSSKYHRQDDVADSLNLSLLQIAKENPLARKALNFLCFFAPSGIDKSLLRRIIKTIHEMESTSASSSEEPGRDDSHHVRTQDLQPDKDFWPSSTYLLKASAASAIIAGALASCSIFKRRSRGHAISQKPIFYASASFATLSGLVAAGRMLWGADRDSADVKSSGECNKVHDTENNVNQGEGTMPVQDMEDLIVLDDVVDDVWGILKSFSILAVRNRSGSMHRLLQQVLIAGLDSEEASLYISLSLRMLDNGWSFLPWDATSWRAAGVAMPHIMVVSEHAKRFGVLPSVRAALLTNIGVYTSMSLSRFDNAQRLLLEALAAHDAAANGDDSKPRARTMHMLGKNTKYIGDYPKAVEYLEETLRILARVQGGEEKIDSPEIAAALHDLGAVKVKEGLLVESEQYLLKALKMKNRLQRIRRKNSFSDADLMIGATLYQLGVIATISRPPHLDRAEALLKQALELERTESAARWATLQQLGRVAIRRGHLRSAEESLSMALNGYKRAYKSDLHVNVAAVHHQLGTVCSARKDYQQASVHYKEALRIRSYLYQGGNHPDIARTLHELGKTNRADGNLEAARDFFVRERDILSELLQNGGQFNIQRCTRDVLRALDALKATAKDLGDRNLLKDATDAIRELKAEVTQSEQQDCNLMLPDNFHLIIDCALKSRNVVRTELTRISSSKKKAELDWDSLGRCGTTIEDVLSNFKLNGGVEVHIEGDEEIATHPGVLNTIYMLESFAVLLKTGVPVKSRELHELYEACDCVRASLRAIGIEVSDCATK